MKTEQDETTPPSSSEGVGSKEPETPEHEAFLTSWSRSALVRKPWMHVPTHGLGGLGVLGAGLVVGVGLLLGGVAAVQAAASAIGGDDTPGSATAAAAGGRPSGRASTGAVTPVPSSSGSGKAGVATNPALAPVPAGNNGAGGGAAAGGGKPASAGGTTAPAAGQTTRGQSTGSGGTSTSSSSGTQPAAAAAAARSSATTAAGPAYKTVGVIRNLMTHYCADLPGRTGSVAENALVAQYTCDGSSNDNQVYQTVTQADGTFLLRNLKSGWCLDVNGGGAAAKGTVVNTHKCLLGSADNQMFRKEFHGSGFFLVNVKSNMCLNVSNPDGVDNKVLGMRLTLFPCSTQDDHLWTFG
ncbi:RICIN domain-containing protein [Kineosporia sp. NBRC 101731]|uniref:RICIN domain-containing protein n=1 Tax=Kineosporia sp. NBRC 101731 TaxID=3032199 RepID=UPI0024A23184|nr:RICIN domain-containing protein [Kineosporia sp. NBRC 101731]GLY28864.1 hypothetical protein Kisp02_22290 [Kineosporia sp. NBRC 101731]